MNRYSLQFLLTAFLIITFCGYGFAQAGKAEAQIDSIMKQLDVVGLSVAVVKKGKIIYNRSFGKKY